MRKLFGVLAIASLVLSSAGRTILGQARNSVWDGVYSSSQAERGEAAYAVSCSSCHGADLGGGEMAPGLTGGEFKANWNGISVADLLERMYRSMPQNAPQSLTRTQNADILAFILRKNSFPPGSEDLPASTSALEGLMFLATKP